MKSIKLKIEEIYQEMPLPKGFRTFLKDIFFWFFGFFYHDTKKYKAWKYSKKKHQAIFERFSRKLRKNNDYEEFISYLYQQSNESSDLFTPNNEKTKIVLNDKDVKLIAFYLPQFHPISENDKWWEKGFTEWTNVTRAVPQYRGHHQPQLPVDLGFYDLRNSETMIRQIELARQYGIYGFCFHYYWFGGKRLLEKPLELFLENKQDLQHPFCLCWANENWTRRWDGEENEVLITQEHSPEDDFNLISDLERYFQDQRYIRVDGKPLLIIYRPQILPNPLETTERWRKHFSEKGLGELFLVGAKTFGLNDPSDIGFDAAVEFPPHAAIIPELGSEIKIINPKFSGKIYDYQYYVKEKAYLEKDPCLTFKTVFPGWDNTARKPDNGHIYHGSYPSAYKEWLVDVIDYTKKRLDKSYQYVFINAWNEWAEGAHLEPDRKYGYSYLQATANALLDSRRKKKKVITIVAPAYNHEKYIQASIQSVADQSYPQKELIIIDDHSEDKTVELIKQMIEKEAFRKKFPEGISFIQHRENKGAPSSINEGLKKAKGDYLTIINTDDLYQQDRFALMIEQMELKQAQLAFSRVEAIDQNGKPILNKSSFLPYQVQNELTKYEKNHHVFIKQNAAISTGNLLFTKELFNKLGPFHDYQYIHDWDYTLRACLITEPLFIKDTSYLYRMHSDNTFLKLSSDDELTRREVASVLRAFFNSLHNGDYSNDQIRSVEIESLIENEYNNKLMLDLWNDTKKMKGN